MTPLGGLMTHPTWALVARSVVIEAGSLLATGRKHRRLELPVAEFSNEQVAAVLAMRVPCAACGSLMQPFRTRQGKSAGRAERPGRLFLALTCPLDQRVGCSRGAAATAAYERVIRHVEQLRSARVVEQLNLFAGGRR